MKIAQIFLLYLATFLVGIGLGFLIFQTTYKVPSLKVAPPIPVPAQTPLPTLIPTPEATQSASPSAQINHPLKKFIISASNYRFFPNLLTVKNGDQVQITLNVISGLHNISIPAYGAFSAQVSDHQTTQIEFIVDQTGTFPFYCDVEDHQQRGMVGKLIVD